MGILEILMSKFISCERPLFVVSGASSSLKVSYAFHLNDRSTFAQ
jgi:hypothetical protein